MCVCVCVGRLWLGGLPSPSHSSYPALLVGLRPRSQSHACFTFSMVCSLVMIHLLPTYQKCLNLLNRIVLLPAMINTNNKTVSPGSVW